MLLRQHCRCLQQQTSGAKQVPLSAAVLQSRHNRARWCLVRGQQRDSGTSLASQAEHERHRRRGADRPMSSARHGSKAEQEAADHQEATNKGVAGIIGLVAGVAVLLGTGFVFKDQIRHFIDYFIDIVDEWGPLGYLAYGVVYTLLELIAIPAIPLTMTAGVIFGIVPGTIVVSGASTAAATLAFLIARYVARDKVLELAQGSDKFKAIDRAIGKEGFKVVTLLRLSPLLPLSLSNYLYGLTSVALPSYVTGSWLGMLPGTIAYVCAGNYGRAVLDGDDGGFGVKGWQVALGVGVTLLALAYIGKVAKDALEDVEQDDQAAA